MNRLGLAAIGYTPDDKEIRPDEGKSSVILNEMLWRKIKFRKWSG